MFYVFNKFKKNGLEVKFNFSQNMVNYICRGYERAIDEKETARSSGRYDDYSRVVPPDQILIHSTTQQGRTITYWDISPELSFTFNINKYIRDDLHIDPLENTPFSQNYDQNYYDNFLYDYMSEGPENVKYKKALLFSNEEITNYDFKHYKSTVVKSYNTQTQQYEYNASRPNDDYPYWYLYTSIDDPSYGHGLIPEIHNCLKCHINKPVGLQPFDEWPNTEPEDLPNKQYYTYFNEINYGSAFLANENLFVGFDDTRNCYVTGFYYIDNNRLTFSFRLLPSRTYTGFERYVKWSDDSETFTPYIDRSGAKLNEWITNSFSEMLTEIDRYITIPALVSSDEYVKLTTIKNVSNPNDGQARAYNNTIISLIESISVEPSYSIQDNFNTKPDESITTLKCGNNKVDILKTDQGSGYILTFKFYYEDDETPFYTHDLGVGTMPCYLSFIANGDTQEGFLNPVYLEEHTITETTDHSTWLYNTISFTASEKLNLYKWLSANSEVNPYDDDITDRPSGGINFNKRPTEDIIPGSFPTKTGLGLNLFTAYRMTSPQLSALGAELWNPSIWNDLKDFYQSPTDMIMGLYMLPFTGDYFEEIPENIKAGNKSLTGAFGHRVTSRYITLDFGVLRILPKWDTYLDYTPTTINVHLPFIGEFKLDSNDVMNTIENVNGDGVITQTGSVLHLYYKVDVLTGTMIAQIFVNGSLHYEFIGTCSSELPYSWSTRNTAIQGVMNGISGFVNNIPSAVGGSLSAIGNILAGSFNAGMAAGSSEVHINGSLGGLPGAISCNYPYVSFSVPKIVMAQDQADYTGLPTLLTSKIGKYYDVNGLEKDFSGFIKVKDIHIEQFTGTAYEKEEIERLLKEGVLI